MTATITLAFIHHAAAFVVVGALMIELVVLRNELTVGSARNECPTSRAAGGAT